MASKFAILLIACLAIFSGGAVVLGWSGLVVMVDRENAYQHLCTTPADSARAGPNANASHAPGTEGEESSSRSCTARTLHLAEAYTAAQVSMYAANLPLGIFFDAYGPKALAVVCTSGVTLGALLIALNQPPAFDSLGVGFAVMSFAGSGLPLSTSRVANQFAGHEALVVSVLSGMNGASAAVLPLMGLAHGALPSGSLNQLFWGFTAWSGLLSVLCAIVIPRAFPRSSNVKRGTAILVHAIAPGRATAPQFPPEVMAQMEADADEAAAAHETGEGLPVDRNEQSASEKTPQVSTCDAGTDAAAVRVRRKARVSFTRLRVLVSSPFFVHLVIVFCVHFFRLVFYLGTLQAQLTSIAPVTAKARVDVYLNTAAWLAPFGFIAAPAAGSVYDARGSRYALAIVHGMGVVHALLLLVPVLSVQIASFVLYTMQQEALFACVLSLLLEVHGQLSYGFLTGILMLSGAICSAVVAPATKLVLILLGGRFAFVYALLLVITLLTSPCVYVCTSACESSDTAPMSFMQASGLMKRRTLTWLRYWARRSRRTRTGTPSTRGLAPLDWNPGSIALTNAARARGGIADSVVDTDSTRVCVT